MTRQINIPPRAFSFAAPLLASSLLASALLGAACGRASDPAGEAAEVGPAGGVVTLFTDSTELFMEHPALIVGSPGTFAVHLTDLTDFAPLRSGRVTMRFAPRDGGPPLVVMQETPRAPGIYGPRPEFTKPGIYDLTILVESLQARDSISVPGLPVHATVAEAPVDSGGEDAGISFLKEQQWKTEGFRTAFAVTGTMNEAFDVSGEIQPAAGRLAQVAAPIGGIIEVAGVEGAPAPGQRVTKGQVLARMTPVLGDAGAAYADARGRLREAEDEYERARRLFAAEAVPQRRVHEAETRLRAAREALAGLGGGALTADGRIGIVAPITGTITERALTPGSRVDAGATLFTIVDASVVWLVAHVPSAQASGLARGAQATFQVEGSPSVSRTSRSISVGTMIDPTTRTVPVTYEVANREGLIRIGSVARVSVTTGTRVTGVLIPSSAILEEDGRPFVYVQTEGETYERRDLRLGGSDGLRTLVAAGLVAGDRVVTGAAYQVKLASLSTAVPTHGHEH